MQPSTAIGDREEIVEAHRAYLEAKDTARLVGRTVTDATVYGARAPWRQMAAESRPTRPRLGGASRRGHGVVNANVWRRK